MAAQEAYFRTGDAQALAALGRDYIRISRHYQIAKRLLDVVFSLLVIIPLILISVVVAVAIRLDSPGPAIYRQRRVGANGKEFYCLKFRSMYANADEGVHRASYMRYMAGQTLSERPDSDMPYRMKLDPRVTRVGKLIRKTSIDELPQFFNVLMGQMTLVGPRPPIPYEVAQYGTHDWLRLSGKPGLTGPYQVFARAKVGFAELVEMDIAYLRQQSIWEDIKLIFLTIPVMLLARGGA